MDRDPSLSDRHLFHPRDLSLSLFPLVALVLHRTTVLALSFSQSRRVHSYLRSDSARTNVLIGSVRYRVITGVSLWIHKVARTADSIAAYASGASMYEP